MFIFWLNFVIIPDKNRLFRCKTRLEKSPVKQIQFSNSACRCSPRGWNNRTSTQKSRKPATCPALKLRGSDLFHPAHTTTGLTRGLKVSGSYVTITEVNWMFMGSSKEIFFCRSWSCCSCWLPPACITSSKWSIPGCRLSRTITERRSGSLRREGRTQISGSWRDPSFSVRLRSFSSISRCLMLNVKHRFNLFDLDI